MYIHTCHDIVIATVLIFIITLGVTIIGVGPTYVCIRNSYSNIHMYVQCLITSNSYMLMYKHIYVYKV